MKKRKQQAKGDDTPPPVPRCIAIVQRGLRTGHDLQDLFVAQISDLVEGRITPSVCQALNGSSRNLLKVIELQMRYGVSQPNSKLKTLRLTSVGDDRTASAATNH